MSRESSDSGGDTRRTEASDPPVVAVVLAGGTGSRLYPASRSDRPKQFLSLLGDGSLLERTVARARAVADEVVVLTREAYADGVRERVPDAEVLVEPAGRDTGPALLYATARIDAAFDDCAVLALPSDHLVGEGFAEAVRRGTDVAVETGRLVTFGLEPTRPETGYGYIEADSDAADGGGEWAPVRSFHEKPDPDTAESYVAAGHYWNAGLFAWRPGAFLDAARDSPLAGLLDALVATDLPAELSAEHADPAIEAAFDAVEPTSVDYAIFEVTAEVAVVPVSFRWDDLGSWDALERVVDPDADGTTTAGDVTVRSLDAADNVVAGDDTHVSLVGVSDLAVVAWDDRVLVVPTERAQDVKALVRDLEDRGEF